MNTATNHPHTTPGRRRVPAVIALAMAVGVALSACSADTADDSATSPTTRPDTSSSSSSTPAPTTTAPDTAQPVSVPPAPAPPVSPAPAPRLPANVVGTGGPCQMLGEVAQAEDGSALFCTEDPGGAGPLWLPQGGTGGTGGAAVADATGQARPGGPCAQEGLAVTSADGDVLTCRLTGGGDVPGGLYWQ
ncbi:hypothetical protein GQF49_15690 [Microbacter sp. ANSKLAB05]|nr:hypothetical protein [Microbacter sp. ANSKLAB05]